jgi:hypothetical protein
MFSLLFALCAPGPRLPDLADLDRFPPHEAAATCVEFNRAYREHLTQRLDTELHHETWLTQVIAETDELYRAWDALADATSPWGCESWRRGRLAELRDLLGPAYHAGLMPPCVPLWRFQIID